MGLSEADIRKALSGIKGVKRRFTKTGEGAGLTVIDDYGHHPVEIAAVLKAARQAFTGPIVGIVQPHRYTRTRDLLDDFARVLSTADALVVTDVYAAGEAPIKGADARAICRAVRSRGSVEPVLVPKVEDIAESLANMLQPGDVVAMMGAGSISAAAHELPSRLSTLLRRDA